MYKIAIIGAGITGLTIASQLSEYAECTVFEKSRGKGGRMSTRRADNYHFDHGAQYFVAKTKAFQQFLKGALETGAIEQWNARFIEFTSSDVSNERTWDDSFKHYVGTPTMSALAHFIAKGLIVENNVHIDSVTLNPLHNPAIPNNEKQWKLNSNSKMDLGSYDWVISTCPVEQTRELLPVNFLYSTQLQEINMQACFAVMLGFKQALPLNFQAALVRDADISWIAVNSDKPQRPDGYSLLIQSNNEWAEKHQNKDIAWVQDHLIKETERVINCSLSNPDYSDVHRWLYANTVKQKSNTGDVFLDIENKLGAAGDWCGNARVESAFTHAMKLVNELKALLIK